LYKYHSYYVKHLSGFQIGSNGQIIIIDISNQLIVCEFIYFKYILPAVIILHYWQCLGFSNANVRMTPKKNKIKGKHFYIVRWDKNLCEIGLEIDNWNFPIWDYSHLDILLLSNFQNAVGVFTLGLIQSFFFERRFDSIIYVYNCILIITANNS